MVKFRDEADARRESIYKQEFEELERDNMSRYQTSWRRCVAS